MNDPGRRGFLGTAAAALAGIAIAPGIRLIDLAGARPPELAASGKVRWGLLIDTAKCATGCTDCVTACNTGPGSVRFVQSNPSGEVRIVPAPTAT